MSDTFTLTIVSSQDAIGDGTLVQNLVQCVTLVVPHCTHVPAIKACQQGLGFTCGPQCAFLDLNDGHIVVVSWLH